MSGHDDMNYVMSCIPFYTSFYCYEFLLHIPFSFFFFAALPRLAYILCFLLNTLSHWRHLYCILDASFVNREGD